MRMLVRTDMVRGEQTEQPVAAPCRRIISRGVVGHAGANLLPLLRVACGPVAVTEGIRVEATLELGERERDPRQRALSFGLALDQRSDFRRRHRVHPTPLATRR